MSALPDLDARVYLFGSWASGCFDAMSDIDLLVLAPDHCAVDAAQRALMAVADDVVGLTDDAWQERLRAADPFVAALASERVLLYGTPEASRDAR